MSSPQLALAAQINGRKSRGPKTPEGKARSASNSRRHGVFSKNQPPDPQTLSDYAAFLEIYRREFNPAPAAIPLIEEAAFNLARYRWAIRTANQILARQIETNPARPFAALDAKSRVLYKLSGIEHRCFHRWLEALNRLRIPPANRKFRQNEPNPVGPVPGLPASPDLLFNACYADRIRGTMPPVTALPAASHLLPVPVFKSLQPMPLRLTPAITDHSHETSNKVAN